MSATTPSSTRSPSARGRHRSPLSRWRRAAVVVLSVGSVLSLGGAFGPVWLVRAGVVAALLTAVLVARFAWNELAEARNDHAHRSSRAAADHRSAVDREHRRQQDRDARFEQHAAELRARIDDLEHQVAGLHTDLVAASGVNHDLAVTVQVQQTELVRLRGAIVVEPEEEGGVADVRQLPRRLRRAESTPQPGWDNLEVDAVTG